MSSKQQSTTRMNRIAEDIDEYGRPEKRNVPSLAAARQRAPMATRKVVSFTTAEIPGGFASFIHNYGSHDDDDDDTNDDKENSFVKNIHGAF